MNTPPGAATDVAERQRPRVQAAGTVPWRRKKGRIEVAVVHRSGRRDWSWPKGKLDPGEDWTAAAVRETYEETGLVVRLGRPLPTSTYRVPPVGDSSARHKEVRYWAGQVVGGHGRLENEIDELRWVSPQRARRLLTYPRDVEQLEALLDGPLRTRTLSIVRHAVAVPRKEFDGDDDRLRPLDDEGRVRAQTLVPILAAYGFTHVVSSPSVRCADTVSPFLHAHPDTEATWAPELSEEGYAADPKALRPVIDAVAREDRPTAICSHGPVHDAIAESLMRHYRTPGKRTKRIVRSLQRTNLAKGEAVVLHLGPGNRPAVLAVERHKP